MPTLITFFNFNSTNGEFPLSGLLADTTGNLFGTTLKGGADSDGTVFEIAKTDSGYASAPTTLVSFNGSSGQFPQGSLITDAAGDLFGTTANGGANGLGTAFEIAKTDGNYASTPTTLVSFNSTDGENPSGGLLADTGGSLFGTTAAGGADNAGTVFEIPHVDGTYANAPSTLVSFNGTNGRSPEAAMIADSAGDLLGTTAAGGADNAGTVFEIPFIGGIYASTPTTLVSFNSANGESPLGTLITDAAGDLFGTTSKGGANGDGTVFEIAKTDGSYASAPTTLVTFDGDDGSNPEGGLIIDGAGDLFGTTTAGGVDNAGTVFEIPHINGTYTREPTTLASFHNTNGAFPKDGLIADAAGDLFGTTSEGGPNTVLGTVFEVIDSGFQVTCYRAGTRIATPEGEVPIEDLLDGDEVLVSDGNVTVRRPVLWIGHRDIDIQHHPKPESVAPICIRKDALATDVPHRDLQVSPEHCIFVDGLLIPVRRLVNGTTIVQICNLRSVEYFHVELEKHALLIAEGLLAESYLDTGNRAFYDNAGTGILLHPEFSVNASLRVWQTDACAPLAVDDAIVEPIWRRLVDRSRKLGYVMGIVATSDDPQLRLLANGKTIRPVYAENDVHLFLLPRSIDAVQIVSRSGKPTISRPWLDDQRQLGIAIRLIRFRVGDELYDMAIDHPDLTEGFHKVERLGTRLVRWTNGAAILRIPPNAVATGGILELHLSSSIPYPEEVPACAA